MKKIYITIYTKEHGKQELTEGEWFSCNENKLTFHRIDGPAKEYLNGYKIWYIDGKINRMGGPAMEGASGYKAWYVNNLLHRKDGPAEILPNGDKEWRIRGKLHREDGPAVESKEKGRRWYMEGVEYTEEEFKEMTAKEVYITIHTKEQGKQELTYWGWHNYDEGIVTFHRTEGPALEWTNGDKEWYIKGIKYTEEEFKKKTRKKIHITIYTKEHGKQELTEDEWVSCRENEVTYHRVNGPAIEWGSGYKEWLLHGKIHREDAPAVINPNGYKAWYFRGNLHREDGPAVEDVKGNKKWYLHGVGYTEEEFKEKTRKEIYVIIYTKEHGKQELAEKEWNFYDSSKATYHRLDGPALFFISNGFEAWYTDGKRHRLGGPAVIVDGYKAWWVNGVLHNSEGSAVEYSNGDEEWYLDGIQYTEEEFKEKTRKDIYATIYTKEYGKQQFTEKQWLAYGGGKVTYHKLDGPAIEVIDGDKSWYVDGKLHRTDGPAREWPDGSKMWYVNGKLHRLDGPAKEFGPGHKEWYVNDNRHRLDGPAIYLSDGYEAWYIDGQLHREDGPAEILPNGNKEWFFNGKRHRKDGPAVMHANRDRKWFMGGIEYTEEEFKKKTRKEIYVTIYTKEYGKQKVNLDEGEDLEDRGITYHRLDGPAIEGYEQDFWYINGVKFSEKQYKEVLKEYVVAPKKTNKIFKLWNRKT